MYHCMYNKTIPMCFPHKLHDRLHGVRYFVSSIQLLPSLSQYLVFEYVEKNLLEVLEEQPGGLDLEQVRTPGSNPGASTWSRYVRPGGTLIVSRDPSSQSGKENLGPL